MLALLVDPGARKGIGMISEDKKSKQKGGERIGLTIKEAYTRVTMNGLVPCSSFDVSSCE